MITVHGIVMWCTKTHSSRMQLDMIWSLLVGVINRTWHSVLKSCSFFHFSIEQNLTIICIIVCKEHKCFDVVSQVSCVPYRVVVPIYSSEHTISELYQTGGNLKKKSFRITLKGSTIALDMYSLFAAMSYRRMPQSVVLKSSQCWVVSATSASQIQFITRDESKLCSVFVNWMSVSWLVFWKYYLYIKVLYQ